MQARLEDEAQCLLVIIGATPEGKKELVGLVDGVRESAQSWRELLLDPKRRGLADAPLGALQGMSLQQDRARHDQWRPALVSELSPIFGDGLIDQAAAVAG